MIKKFSIFESYNHSNQDKLDDMELIQEFSKKFEDLFEYRLNLDKFGQPEFRGYLGYGANVNYSGQIELDNPKIFKRKIDISFNIILDTNINPNGISGENDIGRTFSIKFEIRNNNLRNVNHVKNFYGYSRNIDDILERFDEYLINVWGIDYLTDKEIEERRLKKISKKYNL